MLNIGFTAGAAVGPALAGVVVARAGVQTALLGRRRLLLCVVGAAARHRPGLPRAEPEAAGWTTRLRKGLRLRQRAPAAALPARAPRPSRSSSSRS